MILQLCIVLGALWVGSRYGSLALGAISGIGLAILVFGFGLKPGTPPTDVIYIIIAAVTCAGIMQASGGMDWLIQIAEKLLRKHPDRITFLAPLTTFFLTVLVGTGHVVYTLMPIICDIALKKGIRPERPCGVASIASQVGITCSPIAAAVVAFVTISNANHFDITIPRVLMVSIPACICGLMAAAAASYHRGLDLDKDPDFQKKIADPVQREYIYGIAWMADTYFSNYMPEIQAMLEGIVKNYPWSIALVFFMVSVLINSQGAVVVSMLPLAYSLGIAGPVLLGVLPSVYGYFFIPNYPSDIATVNFDRSGTTVIGKYLLNHSFMMPGLICVFTSTIVAYILSSIFY